MPALSKTPAGASHLPVQLTSFIGRANEINEITGLLFESTCRLLTLVGSGGIGKTRLAIQTAAQVADNFVQGVCFVALQSVQSPDFLVSAIADALDVPLTGPAAPVVQLLHYLHSKEMLLVLDNFEQILSAGESDILLQILEAAPKVKFLVTSREVLSLQEEWLYPLAGLATPAGIYLEDWADHDAVKLLVERIRRVRRGFSLESEAEGIVRLCQLVEGMPLALELAATWTKTLTCADVADEIQHSLDFLSTTLRDLPERHRSMQVVFDQAWQRLTSEEQQVFRRLSVFRGGFRRAAAKAVAGATLPVLTTLVDKSLLRWQPDDQRYQVHELLRQYAAEQLKASPAEAHSTHNLYCVYYACFLSERFEDMLGRRQREAITEIEAELENVRVAWRWAVAEAKIEAIQKLIYTLALFYQFQSRFREGADILEQAVYSLSTETPTKQQEETLASVLVGQGWFCIRLGQLGKAREVIEQSQALYTRLDIPPLPGHGTDPLIPLGVIASIQGNYAEATRFGEAARQRNMAANHKENLAVALNVLTGAFLAQGDYEIAQQYALQAYTIVQETNDRWFMAYCLNELGNVARALSDYDRARQHYQAAYKLRKEFNDPEGMAIALNHQGEIARFQEDYQTAETLYRQSLAIYRDIGDKGGLATTLNGLGQVAAIRGDYRSAKRHLHEALQITTQIQFLPLTLAILANVGELLLRTRRPAFGVELLTFTQDHPAVEQETKAKAQQLLANYVSDIASDDVAAVSQDGQSNDLETIVAAVQAHLAAPLEVEEPISSLAAHPLPSPALVEPLTERELDVLRLLNEGLTNQEIADRLFIVVGTVKKHTSNIYGKLGVSNRTQAVARARELNLLE